MSQADSGDKFKCIRCGEMFTLTDQEKASNLKFLDEGAAVA